MPAWERKILFMMAVWFAMDVLWLFMGWHHASSPFDATIDVFFVWLALRIMRSDIQSDVGNIL